MRIARVGVLPELPAGRAVWVPCDGAAVALCTLVFVGEEVTDLPWRWVADLLNHPMAHEVWLSQRCTAALAPLPPLRRPHHVRLGPPPRPPRVVSGPSWVASGDGCVDVCRVGSRGWWDARFLVGRDASPSSEYSSASLLSSSRCLRQSG